MRARLCRAAVRCPSASLPRSAAHLLPERSEPPERTEDGASELLDVLGEERGTSGEGMEGMIVRLKRKGVGGMVWWKPTRTLKKARSLERNQK